MFETYPKGMVILPSLFEANLLYGKITFPVQNYYALCTVILPASVKSPSLYGLKTCTCVK